MNNIVRIGTDLFSIEHRIHTAFRERHCRALGYFTIRLRGITYGVSDLDATLMACSLDQVRLLIRTRGQRVVPEISSWTSTEFAAFFHRHWSESPELPAPEASRWNQIFHDRQSLWVPDGDAAFDDASFIFTFDQGDQVRLIGFKYTESPEPDDLVDVTLSSDEYYGTLLNWVRAFRIDRSQRLSITQ